MFLNAENRFLMRGLKKKNFQQIPTSSLDFLDIFWWKFFSICRISSFFSSLIHIKFRRGNYLKIAWQMLES